MIINFNKNEHNLSSIICLVYGEVDCRCHVQRQINTGRDEDSVITELVDDYFRTIKNSIYTHKKVIVVGVIPPTKQNDYESLHGPILHQFPFVGTDEDRVRFTKKVNARIEELCKTHRYIYFNPYSHYTREDGTLKHELSDTIVHLGDTSHFIEKFMELYKTL